MTEILSLLRKNIRSLVPYSSARDEYKGEDAVFLDANENPYNSPFNRYPDPLQINLKNRIARIKDVPVRNIFLGNGSDEAIDVLIRAFCEPGVDNIISIRPTYGMYKVCADINGVEFREALLNDVYQVDIQRLLSLSDNRSKLMFLCSPNNPTSNSLNQADVLALLDKFNGLVVLDEAYIDFCSAPSLTKELNKYPNLVILQTFSKAWGMAGIRLGMAFAGQDIVDVLNRIKYPYNINILTQRIALEHLADTKAKDQWVDRILEQRVLLQKKLSGLSLIKNILPSEANFLMVRFENPKAVFDFLIGKKIIVRDRSKVPLCNGYLRITIGTAEENRLLIFALKEFTSIFNGPTRNSLHP
jgi:histidinol-phosphate aminotransferase